MAEIKIAGTLHNTEEIQDDALHSHVAVHADEVLDEAKERKQSEINADTDAALSDRYTKAETYNKTELNNLITTPDVDYVSVVATAQTTSETQVLPAPGVKNTIYRVGKWDGSAYDVTKYSEYAWNGTGYVLLATRVQAAEPLVGYYVCGTAAGTAEKAVSAPNYVLTNGGALKIKMGNVNTADNATLNVNLTGAKPLVYDGARASSANSWEKDDVLDVYYDAANSQFVANNAAGGGKFATGEKVKDVGVISAEEMTEVLEGELPVLLADINGNIILDSDGKPIEIIP